MGFLRPKPPVMPVLPAAPKPPVSITEDLPADTKKDIIDKTGKFCVKNYADDYEYWLRIINHTDSVYVDNVCVYYDIGHAGGRKY